MILETRYTFKITWLSYKDNHLKKLFRYIWIMKNYWWSYYYWSYIVLFVIYSSFDIGFASILNMLVRWYLLVFQIHNKIFSARKLDVDLKFRIYFIKWFWSHEKKKKNFNEKLKKKYVKWILRDRIRKRFMRSQKKFRNWISNLYYFSSFSEYVFSL